jgi:FMN-dependent NADH-azoreductase
MTTLLYIKGSPRGADSQSSRVAAAYLKALAEQNANLTIDTLDVWEENLPAYDGNRAAAKMSILTGQDQSGSQRSAWDEILAIAARFTSADRYLIASPMWNGGIPYRLKQYIDLIHQPGVTFGLTPENGYFGLLKDKHATLVLTAGAFSPSLPSPAFGVDHQGTYLRDWLTQAGVDAIDEVRFQPTLLTDDSVRDEKNAINHAIELARSHGKV